MPNVGSGPGGEALGISGDVLSQFGFPQITNILAGIQKGNMYNQLTQQQPFSKEHQNQVAQQVYSQLASRGITDGNVANMAVGQAFSQEDLLRQSLYLDQLKAAIGLIPGASPSGGVPGQMGSGLPGMAQMMSMFGMDGAGGAGGAAGAGEGAGMSGFGGTGAGSFASMFLE